MSAPTIRGLTLWQPWATLVAIGAKRFETRSWKPTKGVTRIALHAAARPTHQVIQTRAFVDALRGRVDLPRGCILGVFDIVDVLETKGTPPSRAEHLFGDYTPGRFAWRLKPILICEPPIYCKGGQRIWTLPDDIHRVLKQAVEYSRKTAGNVVR